MSVNLAGIPGELCALPQWVVWRQPDKCPFSPATLTKASTSDPATWGSFEEAVAVLDQYPDTYAGIGFVFTDDDPYCGVDLDDCVGADGELYPSARRLLVTLNSYSEISPSRIGVKVIVRAKKPGAECKRVLNWTDGAKGQVEVYDHLRYFTMTGLVLPETPLEIQDRQAQVEQVYAKLFPGPKVAGVAEVAVVAGHDSYSRCVTFLAECPPSISGQNGHDKALRAACECFRFGLSDSDAHRAMTWWSDAKSGGEPWNEKEISHKLKSARAKVLADGEFGSRLNGHWIPWEKSGDGAACAVATRIGAIRDGSYRAAPWVWPVMTRMTQSLTPGSVTLICGSPGSGKSYFMLDACLGWLELGVSFAIFELEDDRTYHLMRALAVLARDSHFADLDWVRVHHEKVIEQQREFSSTLDALGKAMTDAPDKRVTLPKLADWYESVAGAVRVAVIDPVTAASAGEKRWLEDGAFMERVKTISRKTGTSLVLVTHPRVGGHRKSITLDDLAGGADYSRFAHTVMVLAPYDDAEEVVALSTFWQAGRQCQSHVAHPEGAKRSRQRRGHRFLIQPEGLGLCRARSCS